MDTNELKYDVQQATEPTAEPEPEPTVDEQEGPGIQQVLERCPGLSEQQIKEWEKMYGQVHALALGDDVFVFRSFSRREYKTMLETIMSSSAKTQEQQDELYEELVVTKCLLYPRPNADFTSTSKAGVIPAVSQAILYKSHFVSPQMVLANTITL